MNVIRSMKRPVKEVDYGFVGDVERVDSTLLSDLIHKGVVPVMAPLTHDGQGNSSIRMQIHCRRNSKALSAIFDCDFGLLFRKERRAS